MKWAIQMLPYGHCEERSDEAISPYFKKIVICSTIGGDWSHKIASPRFQRDSQ